MTTIESGTSETRRVKVTASTVEIDRVYFVDNGDPEQAIYDRDIPKHGDKHPSIPGLYVLEVSAEKTPESPNHCLIHIVYSREGFSAGDLYQTEIELELAAEEQTIYVDLDGKYLGDEGDSVYRPMGCYVVLEYKSFPSFSLYRNLEGYVNEKTFLGEKPDTWLYLGASCRQVGTEKWQIQHRFLYKMITDANPYGHQHCGNVYQQGEVIDPVTKEPRWEWQVQYDNEDKPLMEKKRVYYSTDFGRLNINELNIARKGR